LVLRGIAHIFLVLRGIAHILVLRGIARVSLLGVNR